MQCLLCTHNHLLVRWLLPQHLLKSPFKATSFCLLLNTLCQCRPPCRPQSHIRTCLSRGSRQQPPPSSAPKAQPIRLLMKHTGCHLLQDRGSQTSLSCSNKEKKQASTWQWKWTGEPYTTDAPARRSSCVMALMGRGASTICAL